MRKRRSMHCCTSDGAVTYDWDTRCVDCRSPSSCHVISCPSRMYRLQTNDRQQCNDGGYCTEIVRLTYIYQSGVAKRTSANLAADEWVNIVKVGVIAICVTWRRIYTWCRLRSVCWPWNLFQRHGLDTPILWHGSWLLRITGCSCLRGKDMLIFTSPRRYASMLSSCVCLCVCVSKR